MLKIYNTLTRKKEVFKPIKKGKVGIYSCGPTVYDRAHIGNLRTVIMSDILKRVLLFNKYKVNHLMNITDVDDKTIKGSKKERLSLKEFTEKYERVFFQDIEELNIIKPNIMPKATLHIKEMVSLIKELLKKGYAYKAKDGIYFSVEKFKDYGKLIGLKNIKTKKSRIKNDEYDKENIQDFSLWKFHTKEDGEVFWETELGKGRPGWHIECSAMSSKYLGQPFDIHTGAVDLIFPHHTNEIAQSEAANGKKFVNFWIHAGFLTMKQGKMSKSLGNIYTLDDIKQKGFSPLDYRYLTLMSHYRSPLLFSFEALENAQKSYRRLKKIISCLEDDKKENSGYLKKFEGGINNDLDMPNALAILWKLVRDEKAKGKIQTIREMDNIFGLDLFEKEKLVVPKEIEKIADERLRARKAKEWKKADELRDTLKKKGWKIMDVRNGWEIGKI